jgi:ligand-binding sensor domain-containing protein
MHRHSILSAAASMTCGLLLCVLDSGHGAAVETPPADDFFVQSWQTDAGLPGNGVNDVLQDQKGFIWLATLGGLVRFDGVNFKQFSSPLIGRVAARNIRALAETADGTLLLLPAVGGVVQLKDGQFSQHPIGGDFAGRQFQGLFVDRAGAVWLVVAGHGVKRWLDGNVTEFGLADGLTSRARTSFATDNEGGVWIASGGFLGCYRDGKLTHFSENLDPAEFTVVASSRSGGIWISKKAELLKMDGGQFSTVSTNLPWVVLGGGVREMFEDGGGALWIGTSAHGLFRFAGGKFARVETSQSQIAAITEDVEGDIWVATGGGGINRLRPKLFQLYNAKSGLPEDVSDAVCADERGAVCLANRSGGVVRISDGEVFVPPRPGPHKFSAYSICADDRGFMWASDGGPYRFPLDHPDQAQSVSNSLIGNLTVGPLFGVHVLFKSRNGDIWIGADSNLFGCFRGGQPDNYVSKKNFPGQRPRSIAEDADGRIWIGTESGQLYQFAGGKFTAFTAQDGLPEAPIRSLCADPDGSVWIGTFGGGLVLRRNEKFTLISTTNGLPDDNIAEMVEDDAGHLWCGTRDGIFHVAKSDLLAFADGRISEVAGIIFGKNEGLVGISCLGSCQPMACKTPDGRLWFATQQGVLSLDAGALKPDFRPPPVFIDELLVNDRPLAITNPLRVPPLCNKIEFRFSALSYAAPQNVRIRYKLAACRA